MNGDLKELTQMKQETRYLPLSTISLQELELSTSTVALFKFQLLYLSEYNWYCWSFNLDVGPPEYSNERQG